MELDKTAVKVGDIIKVSLSVEDIEYFAGYQVNIKYDPELLEVLEPVPRPGEILNNEDYGSQAATAIDEENGILNFGKVYQYFKDYQESGNPENTGVFAVLEFKAIKEGTAEIKFEDTERIPNGITGTMLFNWYGDRMSGYEVVQPEPIVITDDISGKIAMEPDKTAAKVGDIIKVSLSVEDIEYFAGYQVNIKYDPELLEVLEPVPRPGEILNNEDYGSQAATAIDEENGILNFGKVYQYFKDYQESGNPENTGVFAVLEFKAIKEGTAEIKFEDTERIPNGITGTMLFNWYGDRMSGYEVVQPEPIVITDDISGKIAMEPDKTAAKVGDIIKVSLSVEDIEYFAGYQVNIKYDPELLEVLEPVPRPGEILNNEDYGSQAATAIDEENGILNFGKVYQYFKDYQESGNPENTGVFAVLEFKAIKEGTAEIKFEDTERIPNGITGTMLFNWYGDRMSGYEVVQPEPIVITDGAEETPTPTDEPTETPTDEPTEEPTETPTDEPTETNRNTDRRANRRTNRNTNGRANRNTDRRANRRTNRNTNGRANRNTDRRANRRTNRNTNGRANRNTNRSYEGKSRYSRGNCG